MVSSTNLPIQPEPEVKADLFFIQRPFEAVFHSAAARIVDFLIIFREFDYSKADISKKTGLSYKTVTRKMPILVKENIVKITRKLGRSDVYKISDSKRVCGLIQFVDDAIREGYDNIELTTQ
jgi:DNA-binding transcriptional ArsR family regulator